MDTDAPKLKAVTDLADDLPQVPSPVSTRSAPAATTGDIAPGMSDDVTSDAPQAATLVILAGPNAGSTVMLTDEETIVGMNGERWMKLTLQGTDVMIEVLDPTVLVTRNGQQLPPPATALADGDTLGARDFEIVFNTNG